MTKPLEAIDLQLTDFTVDAEATYRIPDEMVAFIAKLEAEHRVIGFRWNGTYQFDILLARKTPLKVERVPQPKKPT